MARRTLNRAAVAPATALAVTLATALALARGAAPVRGQEVADLRPGDLVVVGGRLFDATGDRARPNPGILIRDGLIAGLGVSLEGASVPPGVDVLRLEADRTVLPGFFDLHAHYAIDLFGTGRVDEYEVNPVVFLANGVTSTFPAGEMDPEGMRRTRLEIDHGERPGPRIHNSGPYFGTARPGWRSDAMTPDSIAAEVDHWASLGVRGFKAKGIRAEQLEALIEAAHRHGVTVTAHLGSGSGWTVNPADAIEMGIDRVEHFIGGAVLPPDRPAYASLERLDPNRPADAQGLLHAIDLYLADDVFFDATLTAYGYFGSRDLDPAVYTKWTDEMRFLTPYARERVEARLEEREPLEQFERIYRVKHWTAGAFIDAGGRDLLTVGTDHPSWGEYLSGFSIHRELHALVLRAGILPALVLRAATVNSARALGLAETLGTVEVGKHADLVVVRGDPLEDITSTRNVQVVIKAGERYDPQALLRSVEGQMGPPGPPDGSGGPGGPDAPRGSRGPDGPGRGL